VPDEKIMHGIVYPQMKKVHLNSMGVRKSKTYTELRISGGSVKSEFREEIMPIEFSI